MARIIHPRPQAGKQTFVGVTFYDGFAEVADLHPEVRAALVLHNFKFEDAERPVEPSKRSRKGKPAKPKKPAEVDAGVSPAPFMDLTLEELRTVARIEGIQITDDANAADIMTAFASATSDNDEE